MTRMVTEREIELCDMIMPYMVKFELSPDAPEEVKKALEELKALNTSEY